MVRIAITIEAFEAIARTLPLGSMGYESEPNERGERYVWLEEVWVNRLGAMRRPGETYCGLSAAQLLNRSSPTAPRRLSGSSAR